VALVNEYGNKLSSLYRSITPGILCMTLGGWLTVGVFGIQVFIWVFTDDDLQTWCSLCVFGSKRTAPNAYKSVKQQDKALEEACASVSV
jgi:hypothetical protein